MDSFINALHAGEASAPVAVVATDSPSRTAYPTHAHRHGQLIHAIAGVMIVRTAAGNWVVPTGRAVWVPGGTEHAIEMAVDVAMRTVFVAPGTRATLPERCRVIPVSPLLRELILTADEAGDRHSRPEDVNRDGRVLALILDEIERAPELSLHVPMPHHPALASLCTALLRDPCVPATLAEWSARAHMNERTFARAFKRETGMTHGAWCRHARVLLSLPKLAAGTPILALALELGYDSPSAFAAMFRKTLGVPPSEYFRAR
ncbi:helix-turn-helix transcriptional regulator [Pandoraea nosoerga]|uniref:AraC family transcriptional regulator n=1 Tax=Pandoraea nosoerga TaxID=2508296 RepID=A0A5E4WEK5_9BURK|nr:MULTISPECIES: helix-turn-helix transcriptional regulator [Pandoraea]MBN4665918.1 helix-turn-helix transcriptional regulator [Pandoraea nosoerga]MBN4676092.1 helix-turn-helix transcriptional regulator [Pandoraea nosoerga]MBN4682499.1 helix-turn-helix transcriptional regulator [Pandoraea nosoerga]MBN4745039.1 helix-turn-helix transcriptional regulator [Pandoraea nosoerga]VVE21840.1 AraC family transcriptional regulator [Pandoraea nosoerga]